MNDTVKNLTLTRLGAGVAIGLALIQLLSGWVSGLPNKVEDLQQRTMALEARLGQQEVLLGRIDENVKTLVREHDRAESARK